MYLRLLTRLCEQSLPRASSNVRFQINRLCHAANKNEEKQAVDSSVSTRFPDYKTIYSFPYIKYASAINVAKYRISIFTIAAAPVIIGLYLTDIVPLDIANSAIASGKSLTLSN